MKVTSGKLKKNVVGTGYFKEGRKAPGNTRFSILVFWRAKNTEIVANAKVSNVAKCADDDCIICDSKKMCKSCRGKEIP